MLLRRSPQNLCYVEILAGEDGLRPTGPSALGFHVTNTYLDGEQRRDVGYCALARGARHAAARLLDHDEIAVDPDAYGQLGLLFYANAEWADSRKWWQKAVSADHGDHIAGTMINLAVLEGRQGNPEQARHWYQQVVKIGYPDTAPWAMYNLGALEEKQGHPEQARHWYRQAIETRHPNYAPISMVNLAVLEGLQGNPEEARHWYGQAIQSGHPEQAPKAVFGLGLLDMETETRSAPGAISTKRSRPVIQTMDPVQWPLSASWQRTRGALARPGAGTGKRSRPAIWNTLPRPCSTSPCWRRRWVTWSRPETCTSKSLNPASQKRRLERYLPSATWKTNGVILTGPGAGTGEP
jgi:Tfp pilus assembly protein PilF